MGFLSSIVAEYSTLLSGPFLSPSMESLVTFLHPYHCIASLFLGEKVAVEVEFYVDPAESISVLAGVLFPTVSDPVSVVAV